MPAPASEGCQWAEAYANGQKHHLSSEGQLSMLLPSGLEQAMQINMGVAILTWQPPSPPAPVAPNGQATTRLWDSRPLQ